MAWELLGSTTLDATADSINVTALDPREFLSVQVFTIADGENTIRCRFNNDSAASYSSRYSQVFASDQTAVNQTEMHVGQNNGQGTFTNFYVINKATKEKLVLSRGMEQNSAGAGNAPNLTQAVTKWANTTDSIDEINIIDTQTGQYDVGSQCIVWGTD